MGRVAVVLGSSGLGPAGEGVAATAAEGGAQVLQRHAGPDGRYTLPHQIDHVANLRSLAERGCDRVLALGSVGSLRTELGVGTFLCPDDFIALQLGLTGLGDIRAHRAPGFDPAWRRELVAAWTDGATPLHDGGVYWQAIGPRFETPAEIRLMAAHAHVVGMTLASECVVAGELGLAYAAICVVDNLANGIGEAPLSVERLERDRAAHMAQLRGALETVLGALRDG